MNVNQMTKDELKEALTNAKIDVYRQTSIKKLREDYSNYLESLKVSK